MDELQRRADELLDAADVRSALDEWLRLYHRDATEYGGMHAGLADEGSPVARACQPMKESFARLYSRAHDEGVVRSDLEPAQVLALINALPADRKAGRAYLGVVLAGLRVGS